MAKPRDTTTYRRCAATTKAGKPCRAPAAPTSDLCALHRDPTAAAAIGRRGGAAKSNRTRAIKAARLEGLTVPNSTTDCIRLIEMVMGRLLTTEMRPETAAAVAIVALARIAAQGDAQVWPLLDAAA